MKKSDITFEIIHKIIIWFFLIIITYPLIYIISASISDPTYVNSGEMWLLPKGITFEGFKRVFQNSDIWLGYRNTIFYTSLGILVNLAVTLPCAYVLSKDKLVGRSFIVGMLILTMFFDGGLIPTYLLVRDLGMINTFWAMVIPSAASVWNIIVTMTFFKATIPKELEESAEIDGASTFRIFLQIVLPLSGPIIAVMALFYGVTHWNQYFSAMIYLTDRELYPLQLFLREILVEQQMTAQMIEEGLDPEAIALQTKVASLIRYSVMIISSAPLIIVYPFVQKYFLKGVLIGSLKG